MAKKRKKKQNLSIVKALKDDRFPKLIGLFLLLIGLYLFIAFFSYLFTWSNDMDKALWSNLMNADDQVDNWLGKFGAIVAHKLMRFGFGISSFIYVYVLFVAGWNLLIGKSLQQYIPFFRRSIVFLLWTSFLLAFVLQQHPFFFGGAIGDFFVQSLTMLVGSVGVFIFIIFGFLSAVVWNSNPNLKDGLQFDEIKRALKIDNFIDTISKLVFIRPSAKNKETATSTTQTTSDANTTVKEIELTDDTSNKPETLKPKTKDEISKLLDLSSKEPVDLDVHTDNQNKTDQPTLKPEQKDSDEEVITEIEGLEIQVSPGDDQNVSVSITEDNVNHMEPYDPTLDLPNFKNPSLELLASYSDQKPIIDRTELETNKNQIIETLLNYKIEITKIKATIGPTVTLYEIVPAPGVRISKIKNLEDDIALSLAALGIRIIAPIPGKGTIGIEVPNRNKQVVSLKEVLASPKYTDAKMDLPIALGKTISDEVFVADLAKMPHLLVAGATGQGKSVGINTIIMSLLYKKHPSQLKLILIDPKKVELSLYNKISSHYLASLPDEEEAIITDTSKVVKTLFSLTVEMDERYNLLKKGGVRNINEYNQKFVARRLNPNKGHKFLPFIVLIIDEFADLIMTAGKEVELPIGRLAQLARAVGIHLIIATQRPSVNIITGIIKANFPARLAFKVTSKIDSRTILDGGGAEQLIGRGDMLLTSGGSVIRIQCAFVDTPEVDQVIDHIAEQPGYPTTFYLPEYASDDDGGTPERKLDQVLMELDEHFEDAARLVVMNQQGSTSMLQRRLKLGYNRAGRIMDQLENTGIVGQSEGSKARQVHINDELELEEFLKALRERKNKITFR